MRRASQTMTGGNVGHKSINQNSTCLGTRLTAAPILPQRNTRHLLAGGLAANLPCYRPGTLRPRPSTQVSVARSLVSLQPRQEKIVESESHINKKVLVSAAAVCFLTHFLTVQGMLLAAYLAAATAVPVSAVNHAIKRRNVLPALSILLLPLLVPNVGFLKAIYMNVVNPVSVQIKAHVTLPAVVHLLVGSKHPALKAGLQSAKVASQLVLLALLLQYLFAPKIAKAMRQRAIMLCRAFTTTESQGMNFGSGEATVETWPNKGVGGKGRSEQAGRDGFVSSISRGDPQKWEGGLSGSHDFERLEKLRQTLYRNLPEGQQPSITEIYSHAETGSSQYSYVSEKKARSSEQTATARKNAVAKGSQPANELLWKEPTLEAFSQDLEEHLSGLGLRFESSEAEKAAAGISAELDTVVDGISSPEELFGVLNEQLNRVQFLSVEVWNTGMALRKSEEAREDLVRELEATVGEKRQLGHELTALALKFEAAQGMWERHLEEGGSFSDLVSEEVLDKVVEALTERSRSRVFDDQDCNVVDGDALAAKFRIHADDRPHLSEDEVIALNNAQPFNRANTATKPSA